MFEKVNPAHPDKVADRIAGAIVDLAYAAEENPRMAVEVLIGHGECFIILESSWCNGNAIRAAVERIAHISGAGVRIVWRPQNVHLAVNQKDGVRCGDNGIFKGVPVTQEQKQLVYMAKRLYFEFESDGKYILDGDRFIICQSKADTQQLRQRFPRAVVNPLGDWTGGLDVDTGATNRKLGSDMGDSITGGGLHGKDLSKADVSVNIYAWLKAQKTGQAVGLSCAIGDEEIDGKPYSEIVELARRFIKERGGFEKFAEWGLIYNG